MRNQITQRTSKPVLRTLLATLVLGGFAVAGASAPASAGDEKSLPATMCNPQAWHVNEQYGYAAVFNSSSTSTLEYFCPVLRDMGWLAQVRVRVYDRSPSGNVECKVRARDTNGTAWDGPIVSTSGFSSSPMTIVVPGFSMPWGSGYVLRCVAPAQDPTNGQSGVITYDTLDN